MLPRRRESDLVVRRVSDETLIYDLQRDKAHCLNATAATVWWHCDGRTSVAGLATILQREHQLMADEHIVWLTLTQLQKARLLRDRLPPRDSQRRYSRRDLIRQLGTAAAVPLVMTILAPKAAAQGSDTCTGVSSDMCPNLGLICPAGKTCVTIGMGMAAVCQCQ
jgi:hypothetical protein